MPSATSPVCKYAAGAALRAVRTAENAKICTERDSPALHKKLWSVFLNLERDGDNDFWATHLLRARFNVTNVYGGHVVALAMKAGSETVDERLHIHSMHNYFIKTAHSDHPILYRVDRIRDGRSFATRAVKAIQNDQCIFMSQMSFHVDESTNYSHSKECNMPDQDPDKLLSLRQLLQSRLDEFDSKLSQTQKFWLRYKLKEFTPAFHGIFECKPVNQDLYNPLKPEAHAKPNFSQWIKTTVPIGNNPSLQRLFIGYMSDSTMVETSILPHIVRKGFTMGMAASLDHCMWFHEPEFNCDEWMLWEQYSEKAVRNRTHTQARLWSRDGRLLMTAVQEGIARQANAKMMFEFAKKFLQI